MTTRLRFRSADVRIDLVGALPRPVLDLVVDVAAPMLAPDSDHSPARSQITVGPLPKDPDLAAAAVVAQVDRAVLAATSCLTLHAAAVAGPRGAAVVPASSGLGKSTLAGACLQAGLLLLSDEAACLDPEEDLIWPHPRPLGLDGRSRDLLGLPRPVSGDAETERATAPTLLGSTVSPATPVQPSVVVVPERIDDPRSVVVAELSQGQGLTALLAACLNTGSHGAWSAEAAWARLGRFVRDLRVVRLSYSSPQDGAAALAELLT